MARTEGEMRCFKDYVERNFPDKTARNITPETIAAEQSRIRAEGCMSAIQQLRLARKKTTGK